MQRSTVGRLAARVAALLLACGLISCGGGDSFEPREKPQGVDGANLAQWSGLIEAPMVPVAVANLPNGQLLFWSAEDRFGFALDLGLTYSYLYDPASGAISERVVNETGHDMFCPGTTNLPDGRILVNGGLSSGKTSIYSAATNSWVTGAQMNIPRAYQGNTLLPDGSVLTLGGSWTNSAPSTTPKHAEVWSEASGWRLLPGVPINPMLSVDTSRDFGRDSHLWLIPTGSGRVLHAGPGIEMHWISTHDDGRVTSAGRRADDEFSINGNAVMYDTGKILKVGGGPGYEVVNANSNAYVLDVSGGGVTTRRIASMAYRRSYHNSVVLPNGQVVVIGGMTYAMNFSDANSVLVPELFDPATETFTPLPPIAKPRNYHSVAILLPDARVLSAGGGLCGAGCPANHADMQILSPPYLFNSDGSPAIRPSIASAPAEAAYGGTMTVTTDSPVTSFAIVRLSSATHTVNNDQRRLSLTFSEVGGNTYAVNVPTNPGWALPGYYMLFAMNANGTPSVSKVVRISGDGAPRFTPPDMQYARVGAAFSLDLQVTPGAGGALSFVAADLPPGLAIDPATGRIEGTPSSTGNFTSTITVTDGTLTVSSQVLWTVEPPGIDRFVKLESLSAVGGNPWASMAELTLLDDAGQPIPRTGWSATADSAELVGANNPALNAIDGNPATFWHTQWVPTSLPQPHTFIVNLGSGQKIGGFKYLPRQTGTNGIISGYRFYVSSDGVNWGSPVAEGDLLLLGAVSAEKTVYLNNLALGKAAYQSSTADGLSDASKAVDGDTGGTAAAGSAGTLTETNPWWEVDLGASYSLHTLRLWRRTDCCAGSMAAFTVFTSSTSMSGRTLAELQTDPQVRQLQVSGATGQVTTHALSGAAQYVRVQVEGTAALQLSEVQVFGRAAVNHAPIVSDAVPPTARQGVQTSLQMFGSDLDGDNITWSASGLPTGLSIDPSSGLISGVPGSFGTFSVQVKVEDGRGADATAQFSWTIEPPIVIQPVVAPSVVQGESASFTAEVSGGAVEYSWDFGDGSPVTGYSSSPTVSHSFQAAGIYTVTLTVRAPGGAITARSFYQAVQGSAVTGRPLASSALAYEVRGGASNRLWVVNPDNDTVSVFDAATNGKLAEIPVGSRPRTVALGPNGRAWVVNKGSSSLSLINVASLAVEQSIALPFGSQPFGIVVGMDGNAYVTLEATERLLKLSPAGAVLADVPVARPRHLSMSLDGTRLLVSRFVTAPQPGESTANVQTAVNGVNTGAEVVEFDPATLAQRRVFVLQHSDRVDSSIAGRGVPNYLGAAAISPDGSSAWVPSKQDNILRGMLRDGWQLDFQSTVRAVSSRIDLVAQAEDYPARVDHDNAGLASAAVYHPNGAYLFVALESSRQIAVVDVARKYELFRIETGRAPQDLAVSANGQRLYVHNFMDRTVGVIDLGPLINNGDLGVATAATLSTVTTEKLAPNVLAGKQFFYDARDSRLARDAYISCASCHSDGGDDGRVWDFTGFGEGLRNTINLRGRGTGQGRLHWTGNFDEVQDFEGQMRTLAGGTGLMTDAQFNTGTRKQPLGDPKAGISADLDALAAYVGSLTSFDPSPLRSSDGTLTALAQTGRTLFAAQCTSCHGTQAFTSSANGLLQNVGTIKQPTSGSRLGAALSGLDPPTLRDAWATAPYLHDGSAPTLAAAIQAHTTLNVSAADASALAAFVAQIGSQEAEVAPAFDTSPKQYVKFEALSAVNGGPWASMAEFNLLDEVGQVIPRTGWVASADSANDGNTSAAKAIDGSGTTLWHTSYTGTPGYPHWYVVNLGTAKRIGGFRYKPRTDGLNGIVATYKFYVSNDGVNWGAPVVQGDLRTLGGDYVEKAVYIGRQPPQLSAPAPKSATQGVATSLQLVASDADNDVLSWSATGLPPGVTIDAASGLISGTPTAAGDYTATVSVTDGVFTTSVQSAWTVDAAGVTTYRYVKFEALSAVNGGPWASMAEFNLLDEVGQVIPRTGWVASADSANDGNTSAAKAIDGSGTTLWHTSYTGTPGYPHWYVVNLGTAKRIGGFRYKPRTDGLNGIVATYKFYVSNDGVNWGAPVVQGDLRTLGGDYVEKAVYIGRQPPQLSAPAPKSATQGVATSLQLVASDADNDVLSWSATGLPPGVTIDAASGLISGTPTAAGDYTATVSVTDGVFTTSVQSAWTVDAAGVTTYRYVKFEALSAVNGGPWASMAEFNLLDEVGQVIPRTGWVASADSANDGNTSAAKAIDGSGTTLWHTSYTGTPGYPHWYVVNLGTAKRIGGFRYKPRTDGLNGIVATYKFYVSNDGVNWGAPVVQGDLRTLGGDYVEKAVYIGRQPPQLSAPAPKSATQGVATSLQLVASDADNDVLSWSATGLPPGVTIDAASGLISGTPTAAGDYTATVSVTDGVFTTSVQSAWTVDAAGVTTYRYVKFEALSAVNGGPWASMAEFNLLDEVGQVIPRTGWVASADSANDGNTSAAKAIDGSGTTLWHTSYTGTPGYPHWYVVNLGTAKRIGGFRYKPRTDGLNGIVATYKFYVSNDGVNWGAPVVQGDLRTLGGDYVEKTVTFP